jgi:hypothetical protein
MSVIWCLSGIGPDARLGPGAFGKVAKAPMGASVRRINGVDVLLPVIKTERQIPDGSSEVAAETAAT